MKHLAAFAWALCNGWCACLGQSNLPSFTFTTVAGSPGNYGTNDGVSSKAQFYFPSGIAVDPNGVVFVADTSNNTIRRLAPTGSEWMVSTVAGFPAFGADGGTNDGMNGQARFWRPNGIAVAPGGALFVADHYNHTIRKIIQEGTNWVVSTIAGRADVSGHSDGTDAEARFYSPTGIAVDRFTNLFVVDTANFIIRKITPIGTNWSVTTIAGTPLNFDFLDGTNENAAFNYPFGVALDSSNNVFIADYGNNAIRRIAPIGNDWVVTTVAGAGSMGSADGTNSDALFNAPADLAVDASGVLYVSDQNNHTIRRIVGLGTNWVVSTIAGAALQRGSRNGVGIDARFDKPWGVAVGAGGLLYVVDWRNGMIRMGVPASFAAPILRITRADSQVVLSWPLSASGFELQQAEMITTNSSWSALTNIGISGNSFFSTNEMSGRTAFFRMSARK